MLQMNTIPLARDDPSRLSSKSPITDFIRQTKNAGTSRRGEIESRPKVVPAPIIQTRVPRGFQEVYIAANRGKDVKTPPPPPPPVRQLARTKSCLSSRSLRATIQQPPAPRTPRTVSFGRVEGVTVENIANENKNALWFSRDEYSTMRQEAVQIARAAQKKGLLKETSKVCARGLEKYLDPKQARDPRISVLEHNDLAMYALASNRAVQTARQLAAKDADEAYSIQHESTRKKVSRHHSSDKLLQPARQLALNDVIDASSLQPRFIRKPLSRHHSTGTILLTHKKD